MVPLSARAWVRPANSTKRAARTLRKNTGLRMGLISLVASMGKLNIRTLRPTPGESRSAQFHHRAAKSSAFPPKIRAACRIRANHVINSATIKNTSGWKRYSEGGRHARAYEACASFDVGHRCVVRSDGSIARRRPGAVRERLPRHSRLVQERDRAERR